VDLSIKNELDTLYGMVLNWRKNYEILADPAGGNDHLVADFREEIEEHMYPYIRRMRECEFLTPEEVGKFMDRCFTQVEEYRNAIR
jgi:hypothetical protein